MKRNKTLQNPVVVILLCCVAAVVVYVNTIAPLFKRDTPPGESAVPESDDTPAETATAAPAADTAPLPETSIRSPYDTVRTLLGSVGWRRTTERNPFMVAQPMANGKPSVATIDATSSSPQTAAQRSTSPVSDTQLRAISYGSSGFIALIGSRMVRPGDTCMFGIIDSIDLAAVTLATPHGTRILRLKNSLPGGAFP